MLSNDKSSYNPTFLSGLSGSSTPQQNITGQQPFLPDNTTNTNKNTEVRIQNPEGKNINRSKIEDVYGKIPLYFIQNNGQLNDTVKFYERGNGRSTFFTNEGVYLLLTKENDSKVQRFNGSKIKSVETSIKDHEPQLIKLSPLDSNKSPEIVAEELQDGKVNYLIGDDHKKWQTDIPTYRAIAYKEVYDGIDIKFYGNNRQMEYDIIVKPGFNPSMVRLSYEGIEGLSINDKGDLEIKLKDGKIIQEKPYIYQEINGRKVEIDGQFKILDISSIHSYGFEIASYNKDYPLIVDPVLVYSTYIGGTNNDGGLSMAVDTSGNAYITGETTSTNFPTTSPYQSSNAGGTDAFVTKIDSSGSLVYSTYLGGSGNDSGDSIAVDSSGNAYVAGETTSTNFPTASPHQPSNAGRTDAFITKLSSTGNSLIFSSYLGGSSNDDSVGIAVDTSGNIYLTGATSSSNFPTISLFPTTYAGGSDAYIAKINSSGSLVFSIYRGGSSDDYGNSIAVDSSGNAYVTGETLSTNFPTLSPYQASNAGLTDAFVVKINSLGSIVYSTYLGGSSDDYGDSIAVDSSENVYVTGETLSTNFPTVSPYQASNAGLNDAFVVKINSLGSIVYSTYLGGSSDDYGIGIAVDSSGNVYVTGGTLSTNFPTASPYQSSNAGNYDAFVTKINSSGSALQFSTYFGGGSDDYGIGIAVDSSENAYITGYTWSTNFPTASPYQGSNEGGSDAFVTKINISTTTPSVSSTSPASNATGVAVNTVITATFSKAMDSTTINTSTFMLKDSSANLVAGTVSYDSATYTATFTPSANLSYGTTYTASISKGAKDTGGNSMAADYTWSFTTATAPSVSSTSPASNATGVAVNTVITATFSKAMDSTTINTSTFMLKDSSANLVAGTVSYDSATYTATFTPSANLSYSTAYSASITTGVKDTSGNSMAATYSWSFTTATAPTYTITASAGTGGTISPSGTVTVTQGGSQTFTITPNTGYSISDVTVDGVSVGAVSSYTFSNVTANHTIVATFISKYIGALRCTDGGSIQCLERTDGGSDADNLDNGRPKIDLEYEYKIVVKDTNGIPQYVKLYMTQRSNPTTGEFYEYSLICSGDYTIGATCTYTTKLGPAAIHKFYFEVMMSDGAVLRYPETGEITGPTIELLNGYSIVGVARYVGAVNLDGQTAFGSSKVYRWISDGLTTDRNYGNYELVDANSLYPVVEGEGYFISRETNATLLELETYTDETANTFINYLLKPGWNMISSPYNKNVKLSDIKVRKGSGTELTWTEAAGAGWLYNSIYYYKGTDWGGVFAFESAGGNPDATLIPWLGYWVYLNKDDDVYYLVITKP
jgi:hypothetical protein